MADRNGYIGRAPADSSVAVARQIFSPTGVQTNFTFASGYDVGYLDLYLNGIRLIEGQDYNATDTSTVGLTSFAQNGDILEAVAYKAFNLGDVERIGIQSAGTLIGNARILNFVGTGNTFALNGTTIDVSISGGAGAGGTWATYDSSAGITTSKKVRVQNDVEITGVATAVNFSGNITGTAATFSGNVSVGGVLTYDDVTNVDSVGLSTFRDGLIVQGTGTTSTTLNVSGVSTLTGNAFVGSAVSIYASSGIVSATAFYGDGANLDNIVSGVTLEQAGSSVGSAITTINFSSGATLTSASSGISTVTIATGLNTTAATVSGIVTFLSLGDAQDHKLTVSGISTISCTGGSEGDSHTVRIINSGITTVGFSTFFLFPSGADPSMPTADGAISLISFTVNRVGAGGTQLLAGAALNYS
jgi:hypothetical protein